MPAKKPAAADDVLSLDIKRLTLDELEMIEDIIDGPLDALAKPGAKKAKMLKAMAFVVKRRTNPDITLEDVGRLAIEFKGNAETADPTAPSA